MATTLSKLTKNLLLDKKFKVAKKRMFIESKDRKDPLMGGHEKKEREEKGRKREQREIGILKERTL